MHSEEKLVVLNDPKNLEDNISIDGNDMEIGPKDVIDLEHKDTGDRLAIRKSMLDYLSANDKVYFRSLKEGEEVLLKEEKFEIARELLDRSYAIFLAKFGNHLLKEHLGYFENRPEEDAVIVDLHLKQLHRALEQQSHRRTPKKHSHGDEMEIVDEPSETDDGTTMLRNELLDQLSQSTEAHFRSQQVGEPDLSQQEKREIAEALLNRSSSQFLARFGTHLLEEHLVYFDGLSGDDAYEVQYYLKKLRKNHCQPVTKVGIKNRRFEALKKMVEDGNYFSETEMRNRNPLLYEQLVGQFLTPEERQERLNNVDTTNITLLNLLLEQVDREAVKKLRKEQEEEEDNAMEEEEDDDDDEDRQEEMEEDSDSEEDNDLEKTLWGEGYTDEVPKRPKEKKEEKKIQVKKTKVADSVPELSDAERRLLMEEFRTNMFSSFLEGKDVNFDYSQVDYNSDYDDLEAQDQDEEEKYFDEESSQDAASCGKMSSDGEDMLDQFMNRLRPEPTPQQLADGIKAITHNG